MKLLNKTRLKIKRCAEDGRIILDKHAYAFRVHLAEETNVDIDKVYALLVKIEILTEGKHARKRGPKGSS
jgi:hypothetical protein